MTELTYTERLVVVHCHCGIAVGIPHNLNRTAHEEGKSVYCPLGHTFVYRETIKDELERERAAHARTQQRMRATRDLLEAEERSHRATRGHLTRHRQRAAAGVCPCCNRSFQNVARHMKTKHPDYPEGGKA